jgi:hypothetical protein
MELLPWSPNEAQQNPRSSHSPMHTLESHDTGSLAVCCESPGGQTYTEQKLNLRNFLLKIKSKGMQLLAQASAMSPCHNVNILYHMIFVKY